MCGKREGESGGLACCWVLRDRLRAPGLVWWLVFLCVDSPEREHDLVVLLCGVGWCFENYTVDASIFVVVKFLRAHGGCLGIRNR